MTFLELVKRRYSVRGYDLNKPVEPEKLKYVLECARLAPSAVNMQPWKFYVITDRTVRERLNECYKREWFQTAPVVIVVTANHDISWKRSYDVKDHADIDISIAVEHICLAATEQGLGSCWVCNFQADTCAHILDLGDHEEAVAMIPLGYEAEHLLKEKNRKTFDELVRMI